MNGRADAVCGSRTPAGDPEPSSSVGPASMNVNHQWPRQSYLELGAMPSAVPSARLHARLVVGEWEFQQLADDIELIVSELVTNAMLASIDLMGSRFQGVWSPGPPPIRLWLQADATRVLVQVWDGSDRMPRIQRQEVSGSIAASRTQPRESGHGLVIVEAMSTRVGVYLLENSSGKVVWAEVATL